MKIINVKIKDLKPHPLNEEYYDNENSDNTKLQDSLRKTFEKEGYPNLELVKIDKNNYIYSGNRRYDSCKEEELPFLRCEVIEETFNKKCLTNIKLKKKEKEILETYNQPGLKRDEYSWSVVLKKYGSDNADYEIETSRGFDGKLRNKWCAERTDKRPTEFKDMVDIVFKYERIDLVEKVESGEYSVKDAINEASAKEPEEQLKNNPNEYDLMKHFKNNKKQNDLLLNYSTNYFDYLTKGKMGGTPVMLDDDIGWEPNAISTVLSHSIMSATCKSFNDSGFFAITPRLEPGITDVRILKKGKKLLSLPEYLALRAEIKVAELKGDGSKTKIQGGGGAHRMEDHVFIIAIHDEDGKRQMVLATKMTKNDWVKKGKGKSAKYEMPMNLWAENHFDNKDDWHCLFGDIYKDKKGLLKILCLPTEDFLNA